MNNLQTLEIQALKHTMTTFLIITGALTVGLLLSTLYHENDRKKQNNTIQKDNIKLQSLLDDMSPREFYTHKMSQASLIWDPRTKAYIRKWSKNDTTFH